MNANIHDIIRGTQTASDGQLQQAKQQSPYGDLARWSAMAEINNRRRARENAPRHLPRTVVEQILQEREGYNADTEMDYPDPMPGQNDPETIDVIQRLVGGM